MGVGSTVEEFEEAVERDISKHRDRFFRFFSLFSYFFFQRHFLVTYAHFSLFLTFFVNLALICCLNR